MKKQAGMILMSVMLVFLVIGTFAISLMENGLLQRKMNQALQRSIQKFYTVEFALRQAENIIASATPIHCMLEAGDPNRYFIETLPVVPCSLQVAGSIIHYSVEPLMMDECAVDAQTKQQGVAYFRITAWLQEVSMMMNTVLQSTFSVLSKPQLDCHAAIHEVNLGRQSWRMLKNP